MLAGVFLAAGGTPAARAQSELPEELRVISDVRLEGVRHVSRRALRGVNLKTRRPSVFPWRAKPALRLDYLRADTASIAGLYRHYGYLDAFAQWRIESTRDPHAARVVFVVNEGARTDVATVTLANVAAYPVKELRQSLLARPNRPFDPAYLQLDTLKISALYQERGYLAHTHPSAARRDSDSLRVDVRYDVVEGNRYTIGQILYLTSAGRVRESLGRRELLMRPGDVYRRSRIERSVERLYQTGLFSQVQVTSLPDSTNQTMDVLLRVTERKPRWIDAGIGSGSAQRFRVSGEWGHNNLDTRALRGVALGLWSLDGSGHLRDTYAEAGLIEPWLLGMRLRGSLTGRMEQRDERNAAFVLRVNERSAKLGLSREFSRIVRGEIDLDLLNTRYGYRVVQASLSDSVRAELVEQARVRTTKSVLTGIVERDLRDDRLLPSRGSIQTYVGELYGLSAGESGDYQKHTLQSTWYTSLPNGWHLAARGIGGIIRPLSANAGLLSGDEEVARVPFDRRFRIGGVNSLRGYGENAISANGGLAVLQASLEVRVPLAGPLGAEVFLDTGNVWDRAAYIKGRDFFAGLGNDEATRNDLRYTFGIGARLNLPFGPLRVDFAWNARRDAEGRRLLAVPQFAIGPSF